jgi:hypothetical protein
MRTNGFVTLQVRWSSCPICGSGCSMCSFIKDPMIDSFGNGRPRKTRAPPAAKFFVCLTLLGRPWTWERHQLQNNGQCALCSQVAETIAHLLLFCSYSREVWFRILLSLPGSLSSLRQVTWNPPTGGSLDASCCTKIIAKALILLSSLHAV